MTLLRGLVGVLVGLAVSVGFVQLLDSMLANALAGRAIQSLDDYAIVLNALPVLAIRLVVSSFMALLGGYLCAKLAEHDEMRYTMIAVIFRAVALAGGNAAGYMPPTPAWALAVLLAVSSAAMLAGGAVRAAAATAARKGHPVRHPVAGEKS
ncbi:MAG TPA: hypothetical protein VKC35_08080 [Vicinamibacterales bacterium]|jgi:ABC-type antimicrobial peptide transport system permease subunit|nr:hypothetical protein [Vicinamibacterales bacterium]